MKKGLIFAALALVVFMFSSCALTATKATVSVKVTKQDVAQPNVVVYMYDSDAWTALDLLLPSSASKEVVTDGEGIADFNLSTLDLDVIDSQTTLYFAVFDDLGNVRGYIPVTVRKGDNKRVELKLNF